MNLSERDYIRKKNKWSVVIELYNVPRKDASLNTCLLYPRLPKIKAWIDEHNPGDLLIPFSVALEERLQPMSAEEKAEEAKQGAASTLGKITTAGYASLDVSYLLRHLGSSVPISLRANMAPPLFPNPSSLPTTTSHLE